MRLYVQVANEVAQNESDTCTRRGRHLGWLVLRTADAVWQHSFQWGGTEGYVGTRPRILFPGLSSYNDGPTPNGEGYDEGAYTSRAFKALDQTFFHMVRALLVAQQGGAGYSSNIYRFRHVFQSSPFDDNAVDAWNTFKPYYDDAAAYLWLFEPELIEATFAAADITARDLDYGNPVHVEVLRNWAKGRGLLAPFDVMDFHWYNSGGEPGTFLYLSKAKAQVESILADGTSCRLGDTSPQPDYDTRGKKPAFCAFRRWNQYLDRFLSAGLLLDGATEPYAGF